MRSEIHHDRRATEAPRPYVKPSLRPGLSRDSGFRHGFTLYLGPNLTLILNLTKPYLRQDLPGDAWLDPLEGLYQLGRPPLPRVEAEEVDGQAGRAWGLGRLRRGKGWRQGRVGARRGLKSWGG